MKLSKTEIERQEEIILYTREGGREEEEEGIKEYENENRKIT